MKKHMIDILYRELLKEKIPAIEFFDDFKRANYDCKRLHDRAVIPEADDFIDSLYDIVVDWDFIE